MQTTSTTPATAIRPVSGYASEIMSGAVTAVLEPKTSSPESTTVRLSEKSKDRYAADPNAPEKNDEKTGPAGQPGQETGKDAASHTAGDEPDTIAGIIRHLQERLSEAQQRLHVAQHQMAIAMAEMKEAHDEPQKMAAMTKVQATQTQVISTQGEILEIHARINKILQEQQKQIKGADSE